MKDIEYWNKFYKDFSHLQPSLFAKFISCYLESKNIKDINILDAGCGNGRDSYFLSSNNFVDGCDSSGYLPKEAKNCIFNQGDFCTYDKNKYDLIYSRFTLHSISDEQIEIFLKSIEKNNTYLCIETRSDKGVNTKRYHGDNHYRNFTNLYSLQRNLEKHKFNILYVEESENFAPYKDENPICIRVIAIKL